MVTLATALSFWALMTKYCIHCQLCCMLHILSKHSHELAFKKIVRYLKATCLRGFICNPSSNMKIDCYPDADVAGINGHEKINHLSRVKSITVFTITVADCPLNWQSKLQSETALFTIEAEVIAYKKLLPIIDIVASLSDVVGLP